MTVVEIISVIAFAVTLVLALLLFYIVEVGEVAGVLVSLGYALVYGLLALFQSRRVATNLFTLACGAALATTLVYGTCSAPAGNLVLLLQSVLLAVVAISCFVPPL